MDLKVQYLFQNSLQIVSILSHANPVHSLPTDVFKIYFKITLTCTSGFSKWPLAFNFSHQITACTSLPQICVLQHWILI
jgi:hypothetical protein